MTTPVGFVCKPVFGDLTIQGLKLIDPLIYVACKATNPKYLDKSKMPLTDIAELCNCSTKAVKKSLKRLIKASYIVEKDYSNVLAYCTDYPFQNIPTDIFRASDLSTIEKATMLVLAEYNDEGFGWIGLENAIESGLYINEFLNSYESLKYKGYLFEEEDYCDIDNKNELYIYLTGTQIDWGSGEKFSLRQESES